MAEKGRGAGALRRSFGGGHRIVLVVHLRRTVTDEAALLLVELRSKTVAGRRLFQTANRDEIGTEAFCAEYKYAFEEVQSENHGCLFSKGTDDQVSAILFWMSRAFVKEDVDLRSAAEGEGPAMKK